MVVMSVFKHDSDMIPGLDCPQLGIPTLRKEGAQEKAALAVQV